MGKIGLGQQAHTGNSASIVGCNRDKIIHSGQVTCICQVAIEHCVGIIDRENTQAIVACDGIISAGILVCGHL